MSRGRAWLDVLMQCRRSAESEAVRAVGALERRCLMLESWRRRREEMLAGGCGAAHLHGPLDARHLARHADAWARHRCVTPTASGEVDRLRARLAGARAGLERAIGRRQAVERLREADRAERDARRRRGLELDLVELLVMRQEPWR